VSGDYIQGFRPILSFQYGHVRRRQNLFDLITDKGGIIHDKQLEWGTCHCAHTYALVSVPEQIQVSKS
jgi:hypothetical protein